MAGAFAFTGEWDAGAGLYYYRAHFYDPALGRFLSRDPLVPAADDVLSLNPYPYVRNNPLRYRDPQGTEVSGAGPFMQGYIRTMLNLHGFPNGVQFYQHTLPGNALGVTREFDGSVGISNDGLNPFTFVNTVRHELGHNTIFQRPGYDTSQSSLMAAVRDRIRNSGGMWDPAERLGWTNNLTNRFGLNASEAIQEAEAHALESTYAALAGGIRLNGSTTGLRETYQMISSAAPRVTRRKPGRRPKPPSGADFLEHELRPAV